ncbi:PIF1-like helicase [Medicago truncatula]|uniref:ATP-dependent DNA helicase n=1 Tax=Medicago truncatula TaxID=3880 RepID=A0A072VRB7_MEDTR|nr:PIF1-like helicase [Medicago truncatula]
MSVVVQSRGEIVLTVGSSGIAALLIPGGRIAHLRFDLLFIIDECSTCNVKPNTPLAQLVVQAKLVIWDEASMMHKFCFEALDRSFRDVMKSVDKRNKYIPFGGDGRIGEDSEVDKTIVVPSYLPIEIARDPLAAIVESTYPNILESMSDITYFQNRAILTTKNSIVKKINDYMLDMFQRNLNGDHIDNVHTPEFLNTVTASGLPNHKLRLKVGVPVMLLRNIDTRYGLCNGTRLVITRMGSLRRGLFPEVMLVIRFLYPCYLYRLQMSGFPLSFNEDNFL